MLALLPLVAGCATAPQPLPFLDIADFEYRERMELPQKVRAWHGKAVVVTGYINPSRQVRDLRTFLLVKDQGSCCFGQTPKFNHFILVTTRTGVDYTRDPVRVRGVLEVGEVWDGDWLEAIFVMRDAERIP